MKILKSNFIRNIYIEYFKKNLSIRNRLLFEIISKQKSDYLLKIKDLKINNKKLSEENLTLKTKLKETSSSLLSAIKYGSFQFIPT